MLLQITVALLHITAKCYYKLWQLYYKLQQRVITNYPSFIKILQITAAFGVIKYYGKTITTYSRYYILQRYYTLRRNTD